MKAKSETNPKFEFPKHTASGSSAPSNGWRAREVLDCPHSCFLRTSNFGFRIGALAAAALLAGGCAVGPDYHPPKVNTPAQWSEPLAGGETNSTATVAAWWTSFHDAELDSLIGRAVRTNHTLRIAQARVREARALRSMTAAGFWPSVDASGSYTRNRFDEHGFLPLPPDITLKNVPLDYNMYQAGFDASWEIDVFGGTRRAVEAANADLAAAEFGRRDVLVSLLAEVARNYIEARGFQQRLTIAQQNIRAQDDAAAITRDRYKGGLSSELDVQQAAALLATTQAQVPILESSLQAAVHRLGVLLAQPPGALLAELSNTGPIPAPPPQVPVDLPSELLRRRPDVQRAERELAAANARIGVATADLFPRFYLTGVAGLGSVSANDWFTGGSRFWTAGPTVQWRAFDAGRIRASIRVQNARQEQALAGYELTALRAFEDVENALVAYAKEQVRRRSLEKAVKANREALKIAQDLYKNGLADFLHVLEAERSLYLSEEELVGSERTVAVDLVALYKSLGGGWETFEPTASAKSSQKTSAQ